MNDLNYPVADANSATVLSLVSLCCCGDPRWFFEVFEQKVSQSFESRSWLSLRCGAYALVALLGWPLLRSMP